LLVVRVEKNQRQVLVMAWKQWVLAMVVMVEEKREKKMGEKIVGAMN
jgi:hypothetical protein